MLQKLDVWVKKKQKTETVPEPEPSIVNSNNEKH